MPTDRLTTVPADVLAAVESVTGSILSVESATAGFNSEIAARLRTADGTVFVKGLRTDHPRLWTQAREAEINPHVRGLAPRLLRRLRPTGWDLLLFEAVDGHHADYSPGSADVPMVVGVLSRMAGIPCPALPLKTMPERMAAYSDSPGLFAGNSLLHTDWHHTNVLVEHGRARLVDWAWASRGAAWIDPALWVIWLIAGGHTPDQAEEVAGAVPAWRAAPPRAVDTFASASTRLWDAIVQGDAVTWTERMRQATRDWYRHRTG